MALQLVFRGGLEDLADATSGRAYTEHECLISIAFPSLGPALATLIMIHADSLANPARIRALLHHCKRVVHALAGIGPDLALSRIRISTFRTITDAARERTFLVHEARVLVAFAIGNPARTIAMQIAASSLASLTRHRALTNHELGVLIALASSPPPRTIFLEVIAGWCA